MNRLIVAQSKLPGDSPRVDFRRTERTRWGRFVVSAIVAWGSLSTCAVRYGAPPGARAVEARTTTPTNSTPPGDASGFAERSASPEPAAADAAFSFCGQADARLARVAARVALHEARGQGSLDDSELAFAMLSEGEPHVWPHAFTVSAPGLENGDVATRLRRFLGTLAGGGVRRCGIARKTAPDGTETVAVVVVDALADLATLPTLGHVGEWVHFDATMLVPSTGAKLVILAPTGTPRTVSPALRGDSVRATFALTEPGPFTVQLVAVPSGGPRPVLEAMLFADTPPPRTFAAWPAPGEVDATAADPALLFAMVNAARASESVPPLVHSDALDRVAASEAMALLRLGHLAHDAGDGDPLERVRRAGLEPKLVGENVAHAATLRLAHRLLWESPSHRGNLLDPRFDTLGVGLAPDTDSRVWVCEIFANFAVAGIGAARGGP